jgi:ATP-dependent DNA ligase
LLHFGQTVPNLLLPSFHCQIILAIAQRLDASRRAFFACIGRIIILGPCHSALEFCIPTTGTEVPAGPDWHREIKYDRYRLRFERNRDLLRLNALNGEVQLLTFDVLATEHDDLQEMPLSMRRLIWPGYLPGDPTPSF